MVSGLSGGKRLTISGTQALGTGMTVRLVPTAPRADAEPKKG